MSPTMSKSKLPESQASKANVLYNGQLLSDERIPSLLQASKSI